jgi:hypothetical protein
MLSERARRFLDQCERTTAVPTGDVERILRESGWPVAPAWLEFHDRYAGYVERIYRDAAVWGLVHEDSFWFGPRRAEVDRDEDDEDEGGLFIYCAELHPAYGYRLDTAGRFLAYGQEASSFDVHVERLAVWREFTADHEAHKIVDQERLHDSEYRAELLARLGERPIPEASDSNFAWYADEETLIADDLSRGHLSNVLRRGS